MIGRLSLLALSVFIFSTSTFFYSDNAAAKTVSKNVRPEIESFEVSDYDRLGPGTELVFTLEGTPGGKATVSISKVARSIPLREVDTGTYEGSYTVKSRDKFTASTIVKGNLRVGKRTTTVRLADSLVSTNTAVAQGQSQPQAAATIERFTVTPNDKLDPGTEIHFTLTGTPSGKASANIEGIGNIALAETKSGVYEGHYTVRSQDKFPQGLDVVGYLQAGNQTTRYRINNPPPRLAGSEQALEILSPTNNVQIGSGPVEVRGRSTPNSNVEAQVLATASVIGLGVNKNILNDKIKTDSTGYFSFRFDPLPSMAGTRYEVTVRDIKGAEKKVNLIQK